MTTNGSTGNNDLDMLIKLMGMTTSSSDNEALNALRLANKWLSNKGHNWHDLLQDKVKLEADPFTLAAQVRPKQHTQPPPQYRAPKPPPPPPPPPQKFYNGIVERLEKLEFVTLPSIVQSHINDIEQRWKAQGYIELHDYQRLETTVLQYAPKPKTRRRRTTI